MTFAVEGDLNLDSPIDVPSNISVDGRGTYIRIYDHGLHIDGSSNVIITNVIFKEGKGGDSNDAVRIINGAHDIWLHHVSFSDYGDGLVDITKAATDVTVSWCKFSHHNKVMLIGASNNDTGDSVIRVTLHHNWFKETSSRHPRVRYGKVHAFNNYYDEWGSYGIGCSQKGECYSERNIFEAGSDKDAITNKVGDDPKKGDVNSVSDWKLNNADVDENNASDVFHPSDYYSYNPDNANDGLRSQIKDGAGWQ